jgi:hypothetical protein
MVTTKITFTSAELEFPNFDEFENYCEYLIGREKFIEFASLFRKPMIDGTMLPYEKSHWNKDNKSGYVQQYHEAAVHSKEFQLSLIKSPVFVELQHLFAEVQISTSIEMLPSDELDIFNSGLELIDFFDSKSLIPSNK